MYKYTLVFFYCASFLLLSACADLANELVYESKFTTANVMKLHPGMSSTEIVKMFGEPDTVRVATCGKPPNEWDCTTWEYADRASLTFAGNHDSLKLNNFNVHINTDRDEL